MKKNPTDEELEEMADGRSQPTEDAERADEGCDATDVECTR